MTSLDYQHSLAVHATHVITVPFGSEKQKLATEAVVMVLSASFHVLHFMFQKK